MTRTREACWTALILMLVTATVAVAQVPPAGTVRRPADGSGVVIVPERFLRPWDPVTVFFPRDVGPLVPGAPEDDPAKLVTMAPRHPGAFTWIDSRTLQFRPADRWPPLGRFTWTVDGTTVTLDTLMAPPVATVPQADSEDLEPVDTVTLTFSEPIAPAALAQMVSLELRPFPTIDTRATTWLSAEDFTIKVMDRHGAEAPVSYVLDLDQPIPAGTRATVHLRLALDDAAAPSFSELSFATAAPFRVVSVGSREHRYPVALAGSRYGRDQALDGGSDRRVVVELSAPPESFGALAARNLVRFSPAVDRLEHAIDGRLLEIKGDFDWDTPYRVTVGPAPLRDRGGRALSLSSESELWVSFARPPSYLRWTAPSGLVERFGPRMVPLEGRGYERADLRIYPVDPLARSLWPFPDAPVTTRESQRPPGPGETPAPWDRQAHVSPHVLADHLRTLGSPVVSTMLDLPLRRDGAAAAFGLDLAPFLERITAPAAPGHYLVGLRSLDARDVRQWLRVQATDLSLTTVETPHGVRFVVTSLATARPVAGAQVTFEVRDTRSRGPWRVRFRGTTDRHGFVAWQEGGDGVDCSHDPLRLVVRAGDDVLVLDPTRPPDAFADNAWTAEGRSWLAWSCGRGTLPRTEDVAHLFTERPVYRPGEAVHIKGYLRSRREGRLDFPDLRGAELAIDGPGDLEWRFPLQLTAAGSFHHRFAEDGRPTGEYSARVEGTTAATGSTWRSRDVTFRLEEYRVPRFKVDVHGPDRAPLDRELTVSLTATYYAGGRVAGQPVEWRVTQFPYTWRPATREGFVFSSDGRFATTGRFEATAAIERTDVTDDDGGASLHLNPAIEATAQPRTYVVEATVTGADDQTVTATRRIVAVPPFVLGLKLPRYLERATAVRPAVIVIDHNDEAVAGLPVTVRLLHRQWHSYLRASDFSDGVARYVTDVVDEKVYETTIRSAAEPIAVNLPVDASGVYVVELEARDRLGRAQVVAADLYVGGDEPVTWPKPAAGTFKVTPDRERYAPGDTATLVLQSSFQTARALAVIEAPDGNTYRWLDVDGGRAALTLPIEGSWAPRLPVHLVLMRGRVPGTAPSPGSVADLGKPATLAATVWLAVEPRANRVAVGLEHPATAMPGTEVEVAITLGDPDGAPLAGEVTLWLVDQAVLALAREQRLDPLPDLITPAESHLRIHDSRGLTFGLLPVTELPGGDGGEAESVPLLDRVTVRRNLQPVPFYDPRILVGSDGRATVRVKLPDNLTNFKLRAKAVSGKERFGYATGHLAVRLPVIVQPALPRFVRPGDELVAAAVTRVVEGAGGPGRAQIEVGGMTADGPLQRSLSLLRERPTRLEVPVRVDLPSLDENGRPERHSVAVAVAVERLADGAADAFRVELPIVDRVRVGVRSITELTAGERVDLPAVAGAARPGSVRTTVVVSDRPALARMAAGLDALLAYPYGCTEQRVSVARALLAARRFRGLHMLGGGDAALGRTVGAVLELLPRRTDGDGLLALWPGGRGRVWLTAWAMELAVEARAAGLSVDEQWYESTLRVLERTLRSDYGRFIDGEDFAERCAALRALARAGRFNDAYAGELAQKAQYLRLESAAQVLGAFATADTAGEQTVAGLVRRMWGGVVLGLHQGRAVYGGLQDETVPRNGLILPSETRTLAAVTRALAASAPSDARLAVLVDGLIRLGRGDGWGSTNADAAALLALSELPSAARTSTPPTVEAITGDAVRRLVLGPDDPVAGTVLTGEAPGRLVVTGGDPGQTLAVRADTSWLPSEPESMTAAATNGFVVERTQLLVQADDSPPQRHPLDAAGTALQLQVGDVVEEQLRVVNPVNRHYVAITIPLAAGVEALNPNLAIAPPEAKPAGRVTLPPTYVDYRDDHVAFYYDSLPKGSYEVAFRTRATVRGRFTQPPATAQMMYDLTVVGGSPGAVVAVGGAGE